MLEIVNLQAGIANDDGSVTPIIKGLNLHIKAGEVHAIMGPNGSGKSTLARVLIGDKTYKTTGGSIRFKGQDINELSVDQRARAGMFLAFQYPMEVPGVSIANFLRLALNARLERKLTVFEFYKLLKDRMKLLRMPEDFAERYLNDGFSGGEKKRCEVLQMTVLRPTMALLDETDSGLDIDALKIVSEGVNSLRGPEFSALVITHYQRLLDYIVPDYVHVLSNGQIVKSGNKDFARELETIGYDWLRERQPAAPLAT